ncbi:MAG: flagellar basal body P-ring protein FlgI [Candidatus Margulisiibacteriota bacterium]
MNKKIAILTILLIAVAFMLQAQNPLVRIKDIARIQDARANQLLGFGLIVGLQNTGDTSRSGITEVALNNLLIKMGLPRGTDNKSKNIASVMVTAELPAFAQEGQNIDVSVASLGDATSLKGGTLIQTPLTAADGKVYAVAQGTLLSGTKETSSRGQVKTAAYIPGGAMVERTVTIDLRYKNVLTIVLNDPDFSLASKIAEVLNQNNISGCKAADAATVKVPLTGDDRDNIVALITKIENLKVEPQTTAKIVINEKTGAIVVGQHVVILPAVVSYGSLNLVISEEGNSLSMGDEEAKIVELQPDPTLGSLAKALRSIGATTSDLIAILQVLKRSGSLPAELEII